MGSSRPKTYLPDRVACIVYARLRLRERRISTENPGCSLEHRFGRLSAGRGFEGRFSVYRSRTGVARSMTEEEWLAGCGASRSFGVSCAHVFVCRCSLSFSLFWGSEKSFMFEWLMSLKSDSELEIFITRVPGTPVRETSSQTLSGIGIAHHGSLRIVQELTKHVS